MDTPDYFDKNSGRSEAKENVLNRRLIGHLYPALRSASSPIIDCIASYFSLSLLATSAQLFRPHTQLHMLNVKT